MSDSETEAVGFHMALPVLMVLNPVRSFWDTAAGTNIVRAALLLTPTDAAVSASCRFQKLSKIQVSSAYLHCGPKEEKAQLLSFLNK